MANPLTVTIPVPLWIAAVFMLLILAQNYCIMQASQYLSKLYDLYTERRVDLPSHRASAERGGREP